MFDAGDVTANGGFRNLSAISLQGNNEQCGGISALMLPPCPHTKVKLISVTIIIVAKPLLHTVSCFPCGTCSSVWKASINCEANIIFINE